MTLLFFLIIIIYSSAYRAFIIIVKIFKNHTINVIGNIISVYVFLLGYRPNRLYYFVLIFLAHLGVS